MLLITWLDSNGNMDKQELQFLLNGLAVSQVQVVDNPNLKYYFVKHYRLFSSM